MSISLIIEHMLIKDTALCLRAAKRVPAAKGRKPLTLPVRGTSPPSFINFGRGRCPPRQREHMLRERAYAQAQIAQAQSGILARHKPKGFMARRVTPSHVGLRRGPLLNRHLDCGLVGGCGGRSGYCCCRFISCRGNLRQGRNSFFRPRGWTRPRLV